LTLAPLDLAAHLGAAGEPGFRTRQVLEWVYGQRQLDPDAMANLPAALRRRLRDDFDWALPEVVSRLEGADGSTKLLLKTERGLIESVILRYEGRTSLCVSSQVGCKLACTFCQTGKLGFVRNLGTHEILAQYAVADQIVRGEGRRLSHVVYMGMGEPLDNYESVVASARRLTAPSPEGYGLSARHVTVSTSGIVPRIRELAKDARVALAVSLHASRDALRTELMPINRRYPLAELKAALVDYQRETGNKITIEYILIQGKNCGLTEAKELVAFLHGLRAKVNLIPFNSHPGLPHARPSDAEIRAFQKHLADRSIPAPVRYSKGLEVSGACGQLAAKASEAVLALAPQRSRVLGRETAASAPATGSPEA
jgi:23S rRNA (adenine2503-C2)-methyltransferase